MGFAHEWELPPKTYLIIMSDKKTRIHKGMSGYVEGVKKPIHKPCTTAVKSNRVNFLRKILHNNSAQTEETIHSTMTMREEKLFVKKSIKTWGDNTARIVTDIFVTEGVKYEKGETET